MKRKLLVIFLSLVLVVSMFGCNSSDSSKTNNEKNNVTDDSQSEATQNSDSNETVASGDTKDTTASGDTKDTAASGDTKDTTASGDTKDTTASGDESKDSANASLSVDNTVIYDKDGFKVTAVSFGVGDYGSSELKVDLENNSNKNVTFQVSDVSVNGFMSMPLFSVDITAGNVASDAMTFYTDSLQEGGIKDITSIELKILVFDTETYETIIESDAITLNTGLEDAGTYDASGEVVYDDNDIKIVAQFLTTDELMGDELVFYFENNSDQSITIQNKDVALNSTMVDALLFYEVLPGKRGVAEMSFGGLEDKGITIISEAEFSLEIFNTDTLETIADTDSLTLSFE